MQLDKTFTPVGMPLQQRLMLRLRAARRLTDRLFEGLSDEALYARPIAERHRLIFYLGHFEVFDWNLLRSQASAESMSLPLPLPLASIDATFEKLFAFGIDPVGTALPQDQAHDWPARPAVLAYRDAARAALDAYLAALEMRTPAPWAAARCVDAGGAVDLAHFAHFDPACLLSALIEHRLMHAETLAYLLHRLPPGMFKGIGQATSRQTLALGQDHHEDANLRDADPDAHDDAHDDVHDNVEIPAGCVLLGLDRNDASLFAWDNEFAQQSIEVPAFGIDRCMVSNRQYLAFIEAGGYHTPHYWQENDWAWKNAHNIRHPGFWRYEQDQWCLRTMIDELPLPLDWPVYVSHAEASAYACWAGKSLPTEAQWQRAAEGVAHRELSLDQSRYREAFGPTLGNFNYGNFDFRQWDSLPVQALSNVSAHGVVGLYGNGWEWTSSLFAPFDGFQAFAFYPGYSRDFFDGQHYVLKGGSSQTAACLMRPSFRNWFQAHYQHAYAGFRCVSQPGSSVPSWPSAS